jgi:uncharacterized protein (DUF2235 family)
MKRLFIGIDGTSNAAFYDIFSSNVYRMNLALAFNNKDGSPQTFFYLSGVGTASYKYLGFLGKAFGQGIDELILQAYVNLVSNFEPGDKIYIFGFSRGAVAARALGGLISKSGLVRYDSSPSIAAAWYYFLDDARAGNYRDQKPNVTHIDAKIEFLGVWDTVYGIDTNFALKKNLFTRLRFANFNLDPSVKVGVHILAIDDTRKFFRPMLWDRARPEQKMEQIWLPGVHSDIGGGYGKAFISTASLLSMIDRLTEYCPDVDFDLAYITRFLLPLLDDEVVINNEWKEYFSFLHLWRGRSCDSHADELRQFAHPILAAMTGREIFFKNKTMKYEPSYILVFRSHQRIPKSA